MPKNGRDSLAYQLKRNVIAAKTRNPAQQITDRDTIRTYKASIDKFCTWIKEQGYEREQVETESQRVLQAYADSLQARNLAAATIHTYLAAPAKGLGVPMQQISKPDRISADITRSRGDRNPRGERDARKEKFERVVQLQHAIGVRRAELGDLRGRDLQVRNGKTYVVIEQGKGGKEQWQRVLPRDVAAVREVFSGVSKNEKVFSSAEMHNRIDLHGMRAEHARVCYDYYADRIKADPEYREQLRSELQTYFNEHHDRDQEAYRRFCADMNKNSGIYQLRGSNKELAEQHQRPTDYDRVCLMAVSVYHLAHWRLDVTVANYLT